MVRSLFFHAILLSQIVGVLAAQASDAPQYGKRASPAFKNREDAYYLLSLPKEQAGENGAPPLVLLMHGGDAKAGNSLHSGTLKQLRLLRQAIPEAIIMVPNAMYNGNVDRWQCNCNHHHVFACMEEVISNHKPDLARIYLLGHSMGGQACLHMGIWYGKIFAAVASMSGSHWDFTNKRYARKLRFYLSPWPPKYARETTIQVLEGAKDPREPNMRSFVNAMKKRGAPLLYTVVPDEGHRVSDKSYLDMAEWMIALKLSKGRAFKSRRARQSYITKRSVERKRVLRKVYGRNHAACKVCAGKR